MKKSLTARPIRREKVISQLHRLMDPRNTESVQEAGGEDRTSARTTADSSQHPASVSPFRRARAVYCKARPTWWSARDRHFSGSTTGMEARPSQAIWSALRATDKVTPSLIKSITSGRALRTRTGLPSISCATSFIGVRIAARDATRRSYQAAAPTQTNPEDPTDASHATFSQATVRVRPSIPAPTATIPPSTAGDTIKAPRAGTSTQHPTSTVRKGG